jgi:methylmalonyl-CoA mutase N-terminal domain/subunit
VSDLSGKDLNRLDLEKTYKEWRDRTLNPALKTKPHCRDKFILDIGLETDPIYSPLDMIDVDFDYEKDLGFPGVYPFTRGIDPEGYRSRPWVIRAYSGFGEASRCNKRYKKLLEIGADEIVMAVDLPTQVGYDSDHIMAKGEVGKVGVAVDSLRDMEILFDGIPLNKLKRVSMLGNSFGPVALALFIALGEKQGLEVSEFVVDLQNDVLKEYVARGTYIFPIKPAVILTTDVIGYCARHAPHWYPCTLCANHINAAGAGSSKATAFAMTNGLHYLDHLINKGYEIDELAPLFSMFLDERADFFVSIANFRATRKVWAELMGERYKAQDNRSMALKITSYSHGGETLLEPANNIVRIALSALSYVFGGVQFLYNASYDEVLGTPSEEAAKIAIRTQQILAHEFGITNTTDPLGGSYYLETLTKKIERQIKAEMKKVEAIGGAVAAIEKGYYVQHMNEGALRRQREYERGERIAIGVNKHRIERQPPLGAFRIDTRIETEQVTRLQRLKKKRDNEKVKECLEAIRVATEEDKAMVPPVLEAVRAYATVGEICDVWREVFGEYRASEYFPARG